MKLLSGIITLILAITSTGIAFAKQSSVCIGNEQLLKTGMDMYIDYDNISLKEITKAERYLSKIKTTAKRQKNSCQVKEADGALLSLRAQKTSFTTKNSPTTIISFPQQSPIAGQKMETVPTSSWAQLPTRTLPQGESRSITCSNKDQDLVQQVRKSITEAESKIKELEGKISSFEISEKSRVVGAVYQELASRGAQSNGLSADTAFALSGNSGSLALTRIYNYKISLDLIIEQHKFYVLSQKPLLQELENICNLR